MYNWGTIYATYSGLRPSSATHFGEQFHLETRRKWRPSIMFIYYLLIGLLILISLATLGWALFRQARQRRLMLLGLTLLLWAGAGLLWMVKPAKKISSKPAGTTRQKPISTAAPTPDINGRIAFHSERSGNFDIWVMNDDGSEPRRLTDAPERDIEPDWSPDGKLIVFASARDNPHGAMLYVMDGDGGNQHKLLRHQSGYALGPRWSPDGEHIAYHSNLDGNFDIYIIDRKGEKMTNLTQHPANDFRADWSPDRRRIVFSSDRDGNSEIYIVARGEPDLLRLTDHPAEDTNPRWSPDGQHVLFETTRDNDHNLYLINADGTGLVRLTDHSADDVSPCWAMNGEKIIFSSKRSDDWELYVMNSDGSNLARLTESKGLDRFPAWTPYSAVTQGQ